MEVPGLALRRQSELHTDRRGWTRRHHWLQLGSFPNAPATSFVPYAGPVTQDVSTSTPGTRRALAGRAAGVAGGSVVLQRPSAPVPQQQLLSLSVIVGHPDRTPLSMTGCTGGPFPVPSEKRCLSDPRRPALPGLV